MIKSIIYLFLVIVVVAGTTLAIVSNRLSASDDSKAGLYAKVDKILINQDQILQKLDDITAELKIVKIRATR